MSLPDAITHAVGETAAWLVGRMLGRSLGLEPARAHRVGERVLLAVAVCAALIVTMVYS